jgi:hypothetical protein
MAKNPSDNVSKVTADNANDGIVNKPAANGQTFILAYGKDASALKGTEAGERGNEMTNTGLKKSMKA